MKKSIYLPQMVELKQMEMYHNVNVYKYILVKTRFGEGTGMIIYLRKKTPARTRIEQIINVSMKT